MNRLNDALAGFNLGCAVFLMFAGDYGTAGINLLCAALCLVTRYHGRGA